MGVYLFRRRTLVQRDETMQQVITSCIIVVAAIIIGKIVAQWGMRELLSEEINLVQEQDLDNQPR